MKISHPLVLLFLALAAALPVAAQENALRVDFADSASRSTTVGIFRRHGIVYLSLSDLVQVLHLKTYENRPAGKLEIKRPPYRVKVSAGNPFVVVTDPDNRPTVYQLLHQVVNAADAYFVPLESFVPYVGALFGTTATYDPERQRLLIGEGTGRPAVDIPTLVFEPKSNGMVIRIPATRHLSELESWLHHDGWLYLTITDARADTAAIHALKPTGLVKEVIAIQSPTSVQLTFRLSAKVEASEIIQDSSSNDVLLSLRTASSKPEPQALVVAPPVVVAPPPVVAPAESSDTRGKPRVSHAELESRRRRWDLDVIVLDPGHGGRDPGSIGVGGVREKDITLGIALKLGRLITQNLKDVKVVYTRKDDRFIELYRRGQIANAAGGKLFVSIHGNSMQRKPNPTRGFEVYLLRPGRTEEAVAIAERENAVITLEEGYEDKYKTLTDENFILVTMAQSAYVKASEVFADIAQREMETTGLTNHGVKQAGFYVLVGAAMPNVLVESAYLSNRSDEKFVKSQSGQQKIAEALFTAIKRYKGEYEKLLREGNDESSQ
jgi:N-acetylmuramoyl-L-alanine amidase